MPKIDKPSEASTIKYNESHDELGRFASGDGASSDSGISSHYGGWEPKFQEKPVLVDVLRASINTCASAFLSHLVPDDLKDHKLILSHDGKVGAAVSSEGDVQNVFNNGGPKGAAAEALIAAVNAGGHTLDCYDDYLPNLYSQFGFEETGRMKFNREFAPSDWDYAKYGEPDVVFMGRSGGKIDDEQATSIRETLAKPKSEWPGRAISTSYYDDWGKAKEDSRGTRDSGHGGKNAGAGTRGQLRGTDSGSSPRDRRPVEESAIEFIELTKSVETKIARAAVKAAYREQHTRVEKQAAKELAKYFRKSVKQIIENIPGFDPRPDDAKAQAKGLMKLAFSAGKQNDLLISSASQPVADAFLEGAYAEMRLSAAAKRRKKFFEQESVKLTTAAQAAALANEEIEFPTTAPEWLTEAAQDFIIETFHEPYWLRIPETTRDDVELTLYQAIADGKSIRDIAEEIQEAHGDEYSKYRAMNVAITETTGAMSAGSVEAMRQAYDGSGLTPTKVWLCIFGPTSRMTHEDADSQEVPLDGVFIVGGEECSYPGDARLSPEQRCFCQCSCISGEVESQISDEEPLPDEERGFDPSEPRDDQGQWTSGGGSDSGVEARIGKVTGNKEEADKLITHLTGIDKSHDGAIAAFLDKHPLKEIKVDTKGVPTMKTAKGLYQPDKQRIVIRPQDKMGNAFGFESGSTFSTDWAQAHDSDRGEYQRATFTHEFGHHVEMTLDKLDKTNEFRKSIIKNFMDEEKHVSAYSKTNFHEYFAESFAAYHLDKGKLSERAVAMVEDAIKRAKES